MAVDGAFDCEFAVVAGVVISGLASPHRFRGSASVRPSSQWSPQVEAKKCHREPRKRRRRWHHPPLGNQHDRGTDRSPRQPRYGWQPHLQCQWQPSGHQRQQRRSANLAHGWFRRPTRTRRLPLPGDDCCTAEGRPVRHRTRRRHDPVMALPRMRSHHGSPRHRKPKRHPRPHPRRAANVPPYQPMIWGRPAPAPFDTLRRDNSGSTGASALRTPGPMTGDGRVWKAGYGPSRSWAMSLTLPVLMPPFRPNSIDSTMNWHRVARWVAERRNSADSSSCAHVPSKAIAPPQTAFYDSHLAPSPATTSSSPTNPRRRSGVTGFPRSMWERVVGSKLGAR